MRIEDIKLLANKILQSKKIENEYIEYKKSASFKDKILKTACAFANNYMESEIGLIFIGVEEENDTEKGIKAIPKIPICGIDEAMIETTENQLRSLLANIHPKICYQIIVNEYQGLKYLIIAVEPGTNGPYQTSDKAESIKGINLKPGRYIRDNRDSVLPSPSQELELLKKFTGKLFSSSLNNTATLDDLNYEYMREYLIQTKSKLDIKEQGKLEMAKSLGLISKTELGRFRVKNFAVLMFCDEPRRFIPGAFVKVIREVSKTDKMEAKDFTGPIWQQAKRVIDYFKDEIMRSHTIRKENEIEHNIKYNYPLATFEELLINAIVHKDYESQEYIGVYIYENYISIINHNRPLPPVTIDSLNSKVSFDNRQYISVELKDMFYSLNLIESYGSGVRRAKEALRVNASPSLKYVLDNKDDDYTNVIIKINEEFIEISHENQNETQETTQETTQQGRILEIIRRNPRITIREIASELGLTYDGAKYHISKFKKSGIVERKGSTKAGEWVIKSIEKN